MKQYLDRTNTKEVPQGAFMPGEIAPHMAARGVYTAPKELQPKDFEASICSSDK
jgi:hypothetical protein